MRRNIGEQVGYWCSTVIGSLSDHVDAFGCEDGEWQHLGDFCARGRANTVDQHSFGGVAYAAMQGQINLHAPLVLKEDAVDFREILVSSNHVTGRRGAKGTRCS